MNNSAATRTTPSRRSFCARRRLFRRMSAVDRRADGRAVRGIAVALVAGVALWAVIGWLVLSGAASTLWPVGLMVAGVIAARLAVLRRRALVAASSAALRPRNWDPAPEDAEAETASRPVAEVAR